MVYTPIPKGTDPWDALVNGAFTDQDARITDTETVNGQQWNEITINRNVIATLRQSGGLPADVDLKSWTADPATGIGGVVLGSGVIAMTKLWIEATTLTNVAVSVNTVGVGLVANQSFIGLYDQAGNRIGVSADMSTAFTTVGFKRASFVTPVNIATAGFYYAAVVCNGATSVGITRGSNGAASPTLVNMDLPANQYRFANGPTSTNLPTSIDMSARASTSQTYWMAVG